MHTERAVSFDCEGERLIGVVTLPAANERPARIGVVIVVGGPQYRVGSHRQFVLLARFLADNGVPCMRFDYRGMGDATGAARDFEGVRLDLAAAINTFVSEVPSVAKVVLWGLCDGASAICFGLGCDARLGGAVLLNPWVRTASGEARTMLKHYYLRRLFDRQFWLKLLRGGVSIRRALGGVTSAVGQAAGADGQASGAGQQASVPERMIKGLQSCSVPVAIFLSGRDYVAREFEQCVAADRDWSALIGSERCVLRHFDDADHTFSSSEHRHAIELATLEWLNRIAAHTG